MPALILLATFLGADPRPAASQPPRLRAGILTEALQGTDSEIAVLAARILGTRGFDIDALSGTDIEEPDRLSWERGLDLLVLPGAGAIPARAFETIPKYLGGGGRLLVLGAERPFSRSLIRWEGRWLSSDAIGEILRAAPSSAKVVDFTAVPPDRWIWGSSDPRRRPRTIRIDPPGALREAAGAEAEAVIRLEIEGAGGWDTFLSPRLPAGFPDGRELTVFWARADANTPEIVVEWQEADGSRWIASVALSESWRRYALPPEAFVHWPDGSPPKRGGASDRLDPRRAARISIGIAESHVTYRPGKHAIEIGEIFCARRAIAPSRAEPPILEMLSPWYKMYETEDLARANANPDQAILPASFSLAAPPAMLAPVRRNPGLGIAAGRTYRYLPLIEACDASGAPRGALAAILVHWGKPYPRAAWAWFGAPGAAWIRGGAEAAEDALAAIASRLAEGLFLLEGGAAKASYFRGETCSIGARVRNGGRGAARIRMRIRVLRGEEALWEQAKDLDLAPGAIEEASWTWEAAGIAPGILFAVTEIERDGRTIDRIRQPVRIASDEPEPGPTVTVRDGEFVLGGARWVPFGLNFWPRYASGLEPGEYWSHWLAPRYYDPEAVEEDLGILVSLGMNLVSIQYLDPAMAPALIDFLGRCRAHGVKAIIFIPGGHPFGIDGPSIDAVVAAARLWLWDSVFAYDLAWEPHAGDEGERARLDARWRAWIDERYGGFENAERDWGIAARRDPQGRPKGPSNDEILNDGPWRILVAAYRRYLDDEISRGYGEVVRRIRRQDPRHLFGVRTGYGGTGTPEIDHRMPFDLTSGAAHLDFISPEGYGLGPSWERTRVGGLVTAYGRLAGGGKPVFWAEYGLPVHPQPDPAKIARQAELYESFARMYIEARADGGAGWWFPGGYRVDERSDFGIVAPDGRPRPAAFANARWSPRVSGSAPRPDKTREIIVDRDLHPRGFSALRARHAEEYIRARDAGEWVILKTAGTGTTSITCPAVAAGNVPLTGSNPPKYLNGEFGEVLATVEGKTFLVERSGTIEATPGAAIELRLEIINTAEAAWVPDNEGAPGTIRIVSAPGSGLGIAAPISKPVPFLGRTVETIALRAPEHPGEHRLALTFEARGRTKFGDAFPIAIAVRGR